MAILCENSSSYSCTNRGSWKLTLGQTLEFLTPHEARAILETKGCLELTGHWLSKFQAMLLDFLASDLARSGWLNCGTKARGLYEESVVDTWAKGTQLQGTMYADSVRINTPWGKRKEGMAVLWGPKHPSCMELKVSTGSAEEWGRLCLAVSFFFPQETSLTLETATGSNCFFFCFS